MESTDPGPATSYDTSLGTLITILQPQVDAFLDEMLRPSSSLFPNVTLANKTANEITTYEAIDLAIRRRRNSRLPINRLTIDIIHCIFADALDLDRIHKLHFPPESIEAHRKKLFQLRCVSTSWNAFFVASPRYWSAVNIGVSLAVIRSTLQRAKQAPLCLYAPLRSGPARNEMDNHWHQKTLEERLTQVRSIRTNDPTASKLCEALLSSHLPSLETLELSGPRPRRAAETTRPLRPHAQHLREIKAVNWRPSLTSSQLHELRTLVLGGWSSISAQTIHLLAACTNLLTLHIAFHEHGWVSGATNDLPIVTLPCLRELKLEFGRTEPFEFLVSRLIFPPQSQASLRIDVVPQHLGTDLIHHFSNFILPDTATSPVLDEAVVRISGSSHHALHSSSRRIIYSAGARSVDLGGATSEVWSIEMIKAFQTRLKDPPLTLTLIYHRKGDPILRRMADMDTKKILIKCSTDVSDAMALIWNNRPVGASKTPDKSRLRFASLEQLTVENSRVDVRELVTVGMRQRLLPATSRSCLKRISLVKCHLVEMGFTRAANELASLGVVLAETRCTYS